MIGYDSKTGQFVTRAAGDLSDKATYSADIQQRAVIDPEARAIGMHLYDGIFKIIPIEKNALSKEALSIG